MKIGSDNADTDVNVHDSNDHVKSFHDQSTGAPTEKEVRLGHQRIDQYSPRSTKHRPYNLLEDMGSSAGKCEVMEGQHWTLAPFQWNR